MNLQQAIIKKLKTINDPETNLDVYNLGLIYKVEIAATRRVDIAMTLPHLTYDAANYMSKKIERSIKEIGDVNDVHVHVVWQPKWSACMMSPEAKQRYHL